MTDTGRPSNYNYDSFVPQNFEPLMRFHLSPELGAQAPDFPLWDLEGRESRLSALWEAQSYLVVEFGSFT